MHWCIVVDVARLTATLMHLTIKTTHLCTGPATTVSYNTSGIAYLSQYP